MYPAIAQCGILEMELTTYILVWVPHISILINGSAVKAIELAAKINYSSELQNLLSKGSKETRQREASPCDLKI